MVRVRRGLLWALPALLLWSGDVRAQLTTPDGWFTDYLIFPPILRAVGGNAPGVDQLRLDYINDGEGFSEATALPGPDEFVEPDWNGASAGVSLVDDIAFLTEFTAQTTGGVDTVDLVAFYGESVDSVTYSIVYFEVLGEEVIDGFVELGSDDSVQVLIDGCEVFVNNIGRGCGNPGVVQDRAPVVLTPGPHRALIKVFQGAGGYCFRLRLTDADGNPLTEDPETGRITASLDPAAIGLTELTPVGVALSRTIDPDILTRISTDNATTVNLTGNKTFADADDATVITVTETLPVGVAFTSATPAPTSQDGQNVSWDVSLGDLVANGISYDVAVNERGEHVFSGGLSSAEADGCNTSGQETVLALDLAGILLGDLIGGGLGLADSEPPPFGGINIDTGLFMLPEEVATNHRDSMDTDLINPAPVDASDLIDSVFFINDEATDLAVINTEGVEYQFITGDAHPVSWNGILSNATHDIDKGVGNIFVGGQGGIATGVGVHASAGVTFDLDAMRSEYGADQIQIVTGQVGMDTCGGTVNNYILFSDGDEVLEEGLFIQGATQNTGEFVAIIIPEGATYMTFAAGDANNGIGCDHGVFGDMRILSLADAELPPTNVQCAIGETDIDLTWDHIGSKLKPFRILVNGGELQEVPGDSVSFSIPLASLPDGALELTVENDEGGGSCAFLNADTIYVNCGGPRLGPDGEVDLGDGRTWEEDSPGNPSPFLVSGGNTADFSGGFAPAVLVADTSLVEPDFVDNPERSRLFSTERWANGDVIYRFPLPQGSYDVTLLFMEGCCSDGCEDIEDPALSFGGCRVFDVEVNGEVVADQFAQHVEAQVEIGGLLPNANFGVALAKGPYTVTDTNVVEVAIRDLGGTNPPENASIKGICIEPSDGNPPPPPGQFHRANVDGIGDVNITDGVFLLNFLFLGGPPPPCADAADANDDGVLNITTGVFIFNWLFLGGPVPPAPGAGGDCGSDPTEDELDCAMYENC